MALREANLKTNCKCSPFAICREKCSSCFRKYWISARIWYVHLYKGIMVAAFVPVITYLPMCMKLWIFAHHYVCVVTTAELLKF